MANLFKRLREPSSMAGISVLLGLFGVQIAPEVAHAVIQIVSGVAAVGAVLLPENQK